MKKISLLSIVLASLLFGSGLVFSADFTGSAVNQRDQAGNMVYEFYNQEIGSNNYVEKEFNDVLRYRYIDYTLTTTTGSVACLATFRSGNGTIATQSVVSGTGITNFYSDLLTLRFTMTGATGNISGNIRFYNSLQASIPVSLSSTSSEISTSPTIYHITITTANIEYSQVFPTNCKRFAVSIIGGLDSDNYRIAFATGKVATPTAPYLQFDQNIEYSDSDLNLTSKTLYIASSANTKTAQLLVWE